MATTKKYTVTLPEKLAEAVRAEVGPGNFSSYVTQAIELRREQERMKSAMDWWESEYGPITKGELAQAAAERQERERQHAEERRREEAATAGDVA